MMRLLMTILLACTVLNAAEKTDSALKKVALARLDAFAQRDTAALSTLCDKEYRFISPSGTQMDLDSTKAAIVASSATLRQYTLVKFQTFLSETENMAFAVAQIDEEVLNNKQVAGNSLLVTEVYKRVKSTWKVQLSHVSQRACFYPN